MLNREFHYRWDMELASSPEDLWPLVADTNRFNKDTGLDKLQNLGKDDPDLNNARRKLRFYRLGVPVTWVEEPFEWVRPHRFGVVRRYSTGPVEEMRVAAELIPRPEGGTRLIYQAWARPKNLLGLAAIPIQIGILSAASFKKTFHGYDRQLQMGKLLLEQPGRTRFTSGGRARLHILTTQLIQQGADADIVNRLVRLIETGDDLSLVQIRPYALADYWGLSRQSVLKVFLLATRIGMLDFRWQLLCPQCRVPRSSAPALSAVNPQVHCETCKISYTVDFDRSVELTFRPNLSIRDLDETIEFCIAGPQVTPHVEVQQLLPPYASRLVEPSLELGEYRLRLLETDAQQEIRVTPTGALRVAIKTNPASSLSTTSEIAPNPALDIENDTATERLFILERLAWSDQTVTAAEVTSMQVFRDLFANEALRPGERISVGSLTIAFTDLKQSTRMYREIGDAPAFGQVLDHFGVLRKAIEEKEGAIVKTMGDSVLAVFNSPADAVETLGAAQHVLQNPPEGMRPLLLKVGIHSGPCIAVTLNERLDYFGTTLNVASRLVELSDGNDMIVSRIVRDDAEVGNLLRDSGLQFQPIQAPLKGLEDQPIELWRLTRQPHTPPFSELH